MPKPGEISHREVMEILRKERDKNKPTRPPTIITTDKEPAPDIDDFTPPKPPGPKPPAE